MKWTSLFLFKDHIYFTAAPVYRKVINILFNISTSILSLAFLVFILNETIGLPAAVGLVLGFTFISASFVWMLLKLLVSTGIVTTNETTLKKEEEKGNAISFRTIELLESVISSKTTDGHCVLRILSGQKRITFEITNKSFRKLEKLLRDWYPTHG